LAFGEPQHGGRQTEIVAQSYRPRPVSMTTYKVEQVASKPSEILTTIREVLLTLTRYAKMK